MEEKKKPYVIDVDDNQVFSADFVFMQMQAQGRRIDMARGLALMSLLVAATALVIAVIGAVL